jgi:FlaG/FlaF family flagellin (archaellin)
MRINMLSQKKGISAIVATILLVMLSVVAVTVIAAFVVPFVRENLYEGTECVDYSDYFSFSEEFDYNCYVFEDPFYRYVISVSAESNSEDIEAEVKGFTLAFLTPIGDSQAIEVYENAPDGTGDGMIRRIDMSEPLEAPESGGTRTYVYNSDGVTFEFVKIYPNLNSGKSCAESDSIKIEELCGPVNLDP